MSVAQQIQLYGRDARVRRCVLGRRVDRVVEEIPDHRRGVHRVRERTDQRRLVAHSQHDAALVCTGRLRPDECP